MLDYTNFVGRLDGDCLMKVEIYCLKMFIHDATIDDSLLLDH